MLAELQTRLTRYLNDDGELRRRLEGFDTFAGIPDGHYRRAREAGGPATARAVRCYPFGGQSLLDGRDLVRFRLSGAAGNAGFAISLANGTFAVNQGNAARPCLDLELPLSMFHRALLGRYRWLWLIGLDEVKVQHCDDLPHSDWVTIFEVLVAMQELVECDSELFSRLCAEGEG